LCRWGCVMCFWYYHCRTLPISTWMKSDLG
jgi:hypothetical protein